MSCLVATLRLARARAARSGVVCPIDRNRAYTPIDKNKTVFESASIDDPTFIDAPRRISASLVYQLQRASPKPPALATSPCILRVASVTLPASCPLLR